MEGEQELFGGLLGSAGLVLLGRLLRGSDPEAHLAAMFRVEGLLQGGADAHGLGVAGEHLRPGKNLYDVEQGSVGAEPGENEGETGEFWPQASGKSATWAAGRRRGKRDVGES